MIMIMSDSIIKVQSGILYNLHVFSFFLKVPVFPVARRSAGRLFNDLGAAMLNAPSPNLSRERGTSISLLVADRKG